MGATMKTFLGQVLAVFLGTTLLLALIVLVLLAGTAEEPTEPPKHSVLVVDCGLGIADRPTDPEIGDLLGGSTGAGIALHEAVSAIRAAAEDDRIASLLLLPQGAGVGFASNQELRAALHAFRETGKPCRTWADSLDEKSYHLASATGEIWLQPFSVLEFDGIGEEVLYWKDFFDSLGVRINVIRAGKFKSAFENFVRGTMSPAEREQTESWLSDLYGTVLQDVATSRQQSAEELQAKFLEHPILPATKAVASGLADRRAWFDELLDVLGQESPDKDGFSQIRLEDWIRLLNEEKANDSDEGVVAVVFAEGEIYDGFGESGIAGDSLALKLREIRQDDSVDAVVLRVNSPGGSASASETILREVLLLKESGKPVVVSMGDVAASGGYWISTLASEIWVQPNTITGSIGVISLLPDLSSLASNLGIHPEQVASNPGVLSNSWLLPPDPRLHEIHQQHVDVIYEAFLDRVARGRKLPIERVAEIAQGRVWSGRKAVELGLADGLGDLSHALNRAASLAQLEPGWIPRWPEEELDPFLDFLNTLLAGESEDLASLPIVDFLRKSQAWLPRLGARNNIYARMPMSLRFFH